MASELEAKSLEIKDLSKLLTREDLINQHWESFKSYIIYTITFIPKSSENICHHVEYTIITKFS